MRLAGTINHKSGAWARIIQADLQLAPYALDDLVGDLPDPPCAVARPSPRRDDTAADPFKRIAPPDYFLRLAGVSVPRGGLVRCPAPGHEDAHASCSVGRSPDEGWCCHAASCGARGAIYDLASVLIGGPWGAALRGDAFLRARARVADVFGSGGPAVALPSDRVPPTALDAPGANSTVELWRVRVRDDVDPRIAGHGSTDYASPPQERDDAIALIALLLGSPVADPEATASWTHPIAGGRRTVALERAH
jgi:hypothetical protein